MRFIAALTSYQETELRRYLFSREIQLIARERKRFQCIYLSARHKFTIQELSKQFSVSENSIKSWF